MKIANLMSKKFLIFFALFIFLFNSLVGIDLTVAQSGEDAILIENLLREHNKERRNAGVQELKISPVLSNSAFNKALAMQKSNCWSHYCPDGKSPWEFFQEEGYQYLYAGENLAEGFYSVRELMQAWMNSITHRNNILKAEYKEVGFGIVYGAFQSNPNNIVIAVHFGTNRNFSYDQSQSKYLNILYPQNHLKVSSYGFSVEGSFEGLNSVDLHLSNGNIYKSELIDNKFKAKINDLEEGEYNLFARGYFDQDNYIDSSTISFSVLKINAKTSDFIDLEETSQGFFISPTLKNTVNLLFIVFMSLVFLIDFLVVSKTSIITSKKSLSHLHFSLFFILAIVVFSGSFIGQVTSGTIN